MTELAPAHTIVEAAQILGWSRRSLQVFLRDNPCDDAGVPFYYPNGNRKLFTGRDVERIRAFTREQERRRLDEMRRPRRTARKRFVPGGTSEDALAEARRLLGKPLRLR